jgi:hypothetical protein
VLKLTYRQPLLIRDPAVQFGLVRAKQVRRRYIKYMRRDDRSGLVRAKQVRRRAEDALTCSTRLHVL